MNTVLTRCDSCHDLAYHPKTASCDNAHDLLNCPHHPNWIRLHGTYRSCPRCHYCARCAMLGRLHNWPHTHNKYRFTPLELALI